ncbi:BioY family protein [[Clostridium] hylemonae DSM 15053]|uniref:Biotin transporter n=2 Tax=[Clostridium] hylemonae TaxID=89153 RepID=C0BZI5_9FIRM|nr:BioY family protein [[Clostridium] hylemonae DSM 15053]
MSIVFCIVNYIFYQVDNLLIFRYTAYRIIYEEAAMNERKLSIQDICTISLCTAVTAIMAQISIPMPMGVPMTMQTFAVTLAAVILGAKKGAAASLIYVLLGAAGVPVLANFTGGYQYLIGPTGGFLLTFPVMAYIIGLGAEKFRRANSGFIICLILGTAVNYIGGIAMFCLVTGSSVWAGFTACVLPFIPTAVIKAGLAAAIGLKIHRRLVSAACV